MSSELFEGLFKLKLTVELFGLVGGVLQIVLGSLRDVGDLCSGLVASLVVLLRKAYC